MPVYNEAATLAKILHRIDRVPIEKYGLSKELIIVDDGSYDFSKEIIRILENKFKWPRHNIDKFKTRLSDISENIKPGIKLDIIKERESDNRILECAVSGDANLIVSGDKHLLKLKSYKNIPIVRPNEL